MTIPPHLNPENAPVPVDRLVRALGLLAALVGLVLIVGGPALTTVALLHQLPWYTAVPPAAGTAPGAYWGYRIFCTGVAVIQDPRHPPSPPKPLRSPR
jgi:hypothetical protein